MAVMRGPLIFFALLLASVLIFQLAPGVDIAVSGLFWSPERGWFLKDWPPFWAIYRGVPWLSWIIVGGFFLLLGADILYDRQLAGLDRKRILYVLITALLGPGLLANTILKDHWGRARPSRIIEFGGTQHFTPALIPAHECVSNCSFVSGHGAMAFSLIALAFLVREPRWRRWAIWSALGFGTLVALVRIAQGGHFLSDNVYAALLMVAVAWVLHLWIVDRNGLHLPRIYSRLAAALGWANERLDAAAGERSRWWIATVMALAGIGIAAAFLDQPLALYFHATDDRLTIWFRWITQFGLGGVWLIPSGVAAILLFAISRSHRYRHFGARAQAWALLPAFIFLSVGLGGLLADLTKILVGRARPKLLFQDGSYGLTGIAWRSDHWSFPSGHTANLAALAMALGYLWPRHIAAYWLAVALIALSRVGTSQHYLSDTIGGAWIGALAAAYVYGVFQRSGIRFGDGKAGVIPPLAPVGWRYRFLGWSPGRRGNRGTSARLQPTPRG